MVIVSPPGASLRPFVDKLWTHCEPDLQARSCSMREHMLPTGQMHVVIRLSDAVLWLREPGTSLRVRAGLSMIGGVRSRYYVRELNAPSCSIGAVLRPGASEPLFGVSAAELAGRHTQLDDVWGPAAHRLRDRLLEAPRARDRLAILEAALTSRLPRARGLHPAIAAVLEDLSATPSVESLVWQSGLSHRQYIARFRRAVGLSPKRFMRIQRFRRALQMLRHGPVQSLAALALDAGYADQPHFNREFMEMAGATPTAYLRRSPPAANHLPVDPEEFSA